MSLQVNSSSLDQQWLKTQMAQLRMMLEVSRTLNSTLDLGALLRVIIEVATEVTEAEAASILLTGENESRLYFEATTGARRVEVKSITVPLDKSIAGWIVNHNQSLIVNDAHNDPRHYAEIDRLTNFETRSILGVPLQVNNKTLGVLEVLNKHQNAQFTQYDLEVLEILAAQAAVAITNARLFAQSDQLADVIHELRTPITCIAGYSQLMLMTENLPLVTQKTYLETIHREAIRLGDMVNDFLDLVRLESGRTSLAQEPVNIKQAASESITLLLPEAKSRDISIQLHAGDHLPDIIGDAKRLKQVFVNLINNAIKYNGDGGRVEVKLNIGDEGLHVAVTDTGYGIASELLERIFDTFYRLERDENTMKGTGLGLSIAKQIVEAHGGKIWAESQVDVGSTFIFTLPLPADC